MHGIGNYVPDGLGIAAREPSLVGGWVVYRKAGVPLSIGNLTAARGKAAIAVEDAKLAAGVYSDAGAVDVASNALQAMKKALVMFTTRDRGKRQRPPSPGVPGVVRKPVAPVPTSIPLPPTATATPTVPDVQAVPVAPEVLPLAPEVPLTPEVPVSPEESGGGGLGKGALILAVVGVFFLWKMMKKGSA